MECFYELPEYEQKALKLRHPGPYQPCRKCAYWMKRIESKMMVPKKVYDSGTFQQSLRMVSGLKHRTIVITKNEIDQFAVALLGLEG